MAKPQELSNIREHLGFLVGKQIVGVTSSDPKGIPDAEGEVVLAVTIHLTTGAYVRFHVGDTGFFYFDPDEKEEQ